MEVFRALHKHLEKTATEIEAAVMSVKLNAVDYRQYGFGPSDFQKLCDIYKFSVTKMQIDQILDTFERDTYGEVPCGAFVDQFTETFYRRRQNQEKERGIKAKRFLTQNKHRFKVVADSIVDKQMRDFGSFFKGFDFKKTNWIERKVVFQIF